MKKAPESHLQDLLGELKLSGIKDSSSGEADLARKQGLSYERYLLVAPGARERTASREQSGAIPSRIEAAAGKDTDSVQQEAAAAKGRSTDRRASGGEVSRAQRKRPRLR